MVINKLKVKYTKRMNGHFIAKEERLICLTLTRLAVKHVVTERYQYEMQ